MIEYLLLVVTLIQSCSARDEYLRHYWPIENGSVDDVIGGADMYDGVNAILTKDRFGNENSAIQLTDGYYHLPDRSYVGGEFTIMAWIKPLKQDQDGACLLNLLGGSDEFQLYFSFKKQLNPFLKFKTAGVQEDLDFNKGLYVNEWNHVTVTVNSMELCSYLDSIRTSCKKNAWRRLPDSRTRSPNYIGRNTQIRTANAHAAFDDIRIYNVAFSQRDINESRKPLNGVFTRTTKTTTRKTIPSTTTTTTVITTTRATSTSTTTTESTTIVQPATVNTFKPSSTSIYVLSQESTTLLSIIPAMVLTINDSYKPGVTNQCSAKTHSFMYKFPFMLSSLVVLLLVVTD